MHIYLCALAGTYIVGEPHWWANLKLAHLQGQAGGEAARLEPVAASESIRCTMAVAVAIASELESFDAALDLDSLCVGSGRIHY